MTTKRRPILLLIALPLLLPLVRGSEPGGHAVDSQYVVDRILANYARIRDFEASMDVDIDSAYAKDMTEACMMWKQDTAGNLKMLYAFGSPYKGLFKSDGHVWSVDGARGEHLLLTKEGFVSLARGLNGADMFHMGDIIRTETWSLDTQEATVNSVKCYRLYTEKSESNYAVWVDALTMTKILRVQATDGKDQLQWHLDYGEFCLLDDLAWFPYVIRTRRYEDNDLKLGSTYCFSNVVINRDLSDSVFKIDYATPPTLGGQPSP